MNVYVAGGGLTVNYQSDEITPSISDYVASIRQHCPQFFDASHHRTIITGGFHIYPLCS